MIIYYKFYVSDHGFDGLLLHHQACIKLPSVQHRSFIGSCYNSTQALTVAHKLYHDVSLCPLCVEVTNPLHVIHHQKRFILCEPAKPKGK